MRRIALANPWIGEEEARAVYEVVKSGWVSMGKVVAAFEDAFAQYVGSKHAVATNNGTSALHLALIAAGIGEGDEVLVPDITFISSANVVLYERAVPVLVECDPRTYNLSLEDCQKRLTSKTRAIIAVDMNGMPVDYDAALMFAEKNGLKIIADSAESLGATYKGRKIGAIAPIHVLSFFPNKNVTTGEGGMITINNDKTAPLLKQLRSQGQDVRYNHIHLGYNYRMTDVAAAIGVEQLKRLESVLSHKEHVVQRYDTAFSGDPHISPPFRPDYVTRHSWYMYAVSLKEGIDRDKVVTELETRGIETRLSFPPIHIQPYYRQRFGYSPGSYPVSLNAWSRLIDLPIGVGLTEEEQDFVIQSLKDIVQGLAGNA